LAVHTWRTRPDGGVAGWPGLDNYYLTRPGADEIQLDLFRDYRSNVALYPAFQQYFRTHKPPFLAVWGENDPFFLPAGAEALTPTIRRLTPSCRHQLSWIALREPPYDGGLTLGVCFRLQRTSVQNCTPHAKGAAIVRIVVFIARAPNVGDLKTRRKQAGTFGRRYRWLVALIGHQLEPPPHAHIQHHNAGRLHRGRGNDCEQIVAHCHRYRWDGARCDRGNHTRIECLAVCAGRRPVETAMVVSRL
jgi:hypothetical protein